MIYREKQYSDTLCHFNSNHDPRNGQFTSGKNGSNVRRELKKMRHFERAIGAKILAYVNTPIKDLPARIVDVGFTELNHLNTNRNLMQMSINQAAMQASIQAANQTASLAMTGGMNPFMFG